MTTGARSFGTSSQSTEHTPAGTTSGQQAVLVRPVLPDCPKSRAASSTSCRRKTGRGSGAYWSAIRDCMMPDGRSAGGL
eukprot:scaffold3607_cov114-Isochrysis_galbana.AAC.10